VNCFELPPSQGLRNRSGGEISLPARFLLGGLSLSINLQNTMAVPIRWRSCLSSNSFLSTRACLGKKLPASYSSKSLIYSSLALGFRGAGAIHSRERHFHLHSSMGDSMNTVSDPKFNSFH
jgi:hypothetical protein